MSVTLPLFPSCSAAFLCVRVHFEQLRRRKDTRAHAGARSLLMHNSACACSCEGSCSLRCVPCVKRSASVLPRFLFLFSFFPFLSFTLTFLSRHRALLPSPGSSLSPSILTLVFSLGVSPSDSLSWNVAISPSPPLPLVSRFASLWSLNALLSSFHACFLFRSVNVSLSLFALSSRWQCVSGASGLASLSMCVCRGGGSSAACRRLFFSALFFCQAPQRQLLFTKNALSGTITLQAMQTSAPRADARVHDSEIEGDCLKRARCVRSRLITHVFFHCFLSSLSLLPHSFFSACVPPCCTADDVEERRCNVKRKKGQEEDIDLANPPFPDLLISSTES